MDLDDFLDEAEQIKSDEANDFIKSEGESVDEEYESEKITSTILPQPEQSINETAEYKIYIEPKKIITAKELQEKNIEPMKWIVQDLLPEGVAILASRPKLGKSMLCLNISISVALGCKVLGKYSADSKSVLYVTYEDSLRRLKNRLNSLLASGEFPTQIAPDNLSFLQGDLIPKLNDNFESGLSFLSEYIMLDGFGLIIIDTFGRAIYQNPKNQNQSYMGDYNIISLFQKFAQQHNICLLFVHHTRKQTAFDSNVNDEMQGTTGITAGADTLLVLKKEKNNFILYVTGKDIMEDELNLLFNKETGIWSIKNEIIQIDTTPEREEIIKLLESENREMRTSEIAIKLGKSQNNISTMLQKLVKESKIKNPKYGFYSI